MKRIKMILLLFMILIVSGCSVDYNLIINTDSSVNVRIGAIENTNTLKLITNLQEKEAVNFLYNQYKIEGVNSDLSYVSAAGSTKAKVTASFKSIDDYKDNFVSDIFDRPRIKTDGDIVSVSIDQIFELYPDMSNSLIYDSINVIVSIPFKVTKNNADIVDGNDYKWTISKNGKLNSIEFTYDKSEINSDDKTNSTISIAGIELNYYQIMIIGLVLIALIITIIVFISNKKNNKV